MPTARRAKKKKAAPAPRRIPPAKTVELGDEIHVLEVDLHESYRPWLALRGRALLTGIVCSIRSVKTGKLVAKASGAMGDYVFGVLDTQASGPAIGGARNADRPEVKRAVAQALKKAAQSGRAVSDATSLLREGPLAGVDGWRVLRLVANDVYTESPLAAVYPRKAK